MGAASSAGATTGSDVEAGKPAAAPSRASFVTRVRTRLAVGSFSACFLCLPSSAAQDRYSISVVMTSSCTESSAIHGKRCLTQSMSTAGAPWTTWAPSTSALTTEVKKEASSEMYDQPSERVEDSLADDEERAGLEQAIFGLGRQVEGGKR